MVSEQEYIKFLGVRIRQLREEINISQQVLADICNVPKSTIGRLERGEVNPTVKTLLKISNALNIELIHLFSFKVH